MSRPRAWTSETKPVWLLSGEARAKRIEADTEEDRKRPKRIRRLRQKTGVYDDGSEDIALFDVDEIA